MAEWDKSESLERLTGYARAASGRPFLWSAHLFPSDGSDEEEVLMSRNHEWDVSPGA